MRRESLLFVALVIPTTRPAIEIKGFHLVESQAEKRHMEMTAERARIYKPDNVMALDNLRSQIYTNLTKPYEISGALGLVDSQSSDFQIHSASEVVSPDGYLFKT